MKENGFDLLQLAKRPDGKVDVDRVMRTFAHEMHRSGFADGADMFRTIELELGVEAAKPVAQDYRLLLAVYNRAARQAIDAGTQSFVFDDELVEKVRLFTGSARR